MSTEKFVNVALTKAELWELKSIFEAGFAYGAEGNEVATRVADKLRRALGRAT